MRETELTGQGGAGRGQGRKPLEGDAKPYKLLLPAELRAKLDDLGGPEWLRSQLTLAAYLDDLNLESAVNLSARYINAMRQLPQYHYATENKGALTHIMTGVRVVPLGDLTDKDDDSGILEVIYPGGHRMQVVGQSLFEMAVAEGARWELETAPAELLPEKKWDSVQRRSVQLQEHLSRKHNLG